MTRRSLGEALRPLGGYGLLALVFFHGLLGQLRSAILADDAFLVPGESDAFRFLWGYWWDQKAVLLGKSPLFCDWIFPPTGADLRWHTHVLLPTLLTFPVRAVVGVVGGYNVMVLAMIVGGAAVLERFLRVTLRLSSLAAFLGGALFGFTPYFVFKAHAHVNLIGAVFWGAALTTLLGAYLERDFTLRRGALFAVMLWATFWTSFVELTMLVVVAGTTVLVFEVGERFAPRERLRFLAPSIAGVVSLVPFATRGDAHVVSVPLFLPLSVASLRRFPRLSMLAGFGSARVSEFSGTYLPLILLVPAVCGAVLAIRRRVPFAKRLAAIALVCAAFTFDPFRLVSTVLRALPLGDGFRVFGRFFPFVLFFLAIFAAFGIDRALARLGRRARVVCAVAFAAVAAIEMYPVHLAVSPVRSLGLTADATRALDPSRRLLIVPRGDHRPVLDTYQIDLDLPGVTLSYFARQDPDVAASREQSFPRVYGVLPMAFDDPAMRSELLRLGVGYVLFEDRRTIRAFPDGREIARHDAASLWKLDAPE